MTDQQSNFREFQTMVAYVATHPRLQEIVEDLEADAKAEKKLLNEANKAPKKHLNDRGFDLPEGWNVSITHDSPLDIAICVGSHCLHLAFHASAHTHTADWPLIDAPH